MDSVRAGVLPVSWWLTSSSFCLCRDKLLRSCSAYSGASDSVLRRRWFQFVPVVMQRQVPTAFSLFAGAVEEFHGFLRAVLRYPHLDPGHYFYEPSLYLAGTCPHVHASVYGCFWKNVTQCLRHGCARAVRTWRCLFSLEFGRISSLFNEKGSSDLAVDSRPDLRCVLRHGEVCTVDASTAWIAEVMLYLTGTLTLSQDCLRRVFPVFDTGGEVAGVAGSLDFQVTCDQLVSVTVVAPPCLCGHTHRTSRHASETTNNKAQTGVRYCFSRVNCSLSQVVDMSLRQGWRSVELPMKVLKIFSQSRIQQRLFSSRSLAFQVVVEVYKVFHPRQSSTASAAQSVDIPVPGGIPHLDPGSAASSAVSRDEAFQGVFRTFPRVQKSAAGRSSAGAAAHSSSWTAAAYEGEEPLSFLESASKEEDPDRWRDEYGRTWLRSALYLGRWYLLGTSLDVDVIWEEPG